MDIVMTISLVAGIASVSCISLTLFGIAIGKI